MEKAEKLQKRLEELRLEKLILQEELEIDGLRARKKLNNSSAAAVDHLRDHLFLANRGQLPELLSELTLAKWLNFKDEYSFYSSRCNDPAPMTFFLHPSIISSFGIEQLLNDGQSDDIKSSNLQLECAVRHKVGPKSIMQSTGLLMKTKMLHAKDPKDMQDNLIKYIKDFRDVVEFCSQCLPDNTTIVNVFTENVSDSDLRNELKDDRKRLKTLNDVVDRSLTYCEQKTKGPSVWGIRISILFFCLAMLLFFSADMINSYNRPVATKRKGMK